MQALIIPVVIVSVVGLVAGIGLSIASKVMSVPVDPKIAQLNEALPGANCGACGFSGCSGYAEALASGEAENGLCSPGGEETANEISSILGVGTASMAVSSAVVCCLGNNDNTTKKYRYKGIETCAAASQLFGGPSSCIYGCLGFGDCVKACPYDAISVCNGVAIIDPELCKSCSMCVSACPKNLIEINQFECAKAIVMCRNKSKGARTRQVCKTGCIACSRCVKTCPEGAIELKDNCAHINNELCVGCGKCLDVCKPGCILEVG